MRYAIVIEKAANNYSAYVKPDSVRPVRPGRVVVQRLGLAGDPPRRYLLRVFVDVDRRPPEIVTLYRTSRIEKYRSPS